jgi:hypothetical protein
MPSATSAADEAQFEQQKATILGLKLLFIFLSPVLTNYFQLTIDCLRLIIDY